MNTNTLRMMFLASAVVSAALVVQGHTSWVSAVKTSSDKENAKTATLTTQQSDIAIAEERYKLGCLQIGVKGTAVQVQEGMAVYGHSYEASKTPLADGTVICDEWGGTAVMKNGAASEFASSPRVRNTN